MISYAALVIPVYLASKHQNLTLFSVTGAGFDAKTGQSECYRTLQSYAVFTFLESH